MSSGASISHLLAEKFTDEEDARYSDEESESSLARDKVPRSAFAKKFISWLWTLYTCIASIFLILGIAFWPESTCYHTLGSYETGFNTDIVVMMPEIEIVKVRFTGGLEFDNNGKVYRVVSDNPIQYVGDPSPEIDENWARLEGGVEMLLSRKEAMTVSHGEIRSVQEKETDLYRVSADVSHSLHCLNVIRKAIYADYYKAETKLTFWGLHVEHCIDFVRQALQCHSDLTPLGYRFNTTLRTHGVGVPNWGSTHTCRNFDKILKFGLERAAVEDLHTSGDDNGYPEDCTPQTTDACKPAGGP